MVLIGIDWLREDNRNIWRVSTSYFQCYRAIKPDNAVRGQDTCKQQPTPPHENNNNAPDPCVVAATVESEHKEKPVKERPHRQEEFRYNRLSNLRLCDLSKNIVDFAKDQDGSRFIQQKLERASKEEKQMVFEEVIVDARQLMTDVFGNYVIQKFLEFGTPEQKKRLLCAMRGNVMTLALQVYGCRVIQKALESIEPEQQMELLREMEGQVIRCVRDQNGNHVIQKVIEQVDPKRLQFIIDAFTKGGQDSMSTLARHPYGCRVIQRVLEKCTESQKRAIQELLQKNVKSLITDQYGNYVIQHIIEHGSSTDRDAIVQEICGDVLRFAQHKFASNVIEKCLTHGSPEHKNILISEVCSDRRKPIPLLEMIKDPYANYVVQKMLDVADTIHWKQIMAVIKPFSHHLRKLNFNRSGTAMDVAADLSSVFASAPIERLDKERLKWMTPRKFGAITKAIDRIGELSAKAQGLRRPLTSYDRLCDSDDGHVLYLYWEKPESSPFSRILGYLKISRRKLYLRDLQDRQFITSPVCLLDFYVMDSAQHHGIGRRLFDDMLAREETEASKVAFDKPPEAVLTFLDKQYGLNEPVWQNTNFVVFSSFFDGLSAEARIAADGYHSGWSSRRPSAQSSVSDSRNRSPRLPARQVDHAGAIIHGTEPMPVRETPGADTPRGRKNMRDFGHQNIFG